MHKNKQQKKNIMDKWRMSAIRWHYVLCVALSVTRIASKGVHNFNYLHYICCHWFQYFLNICAYFNLIFFLLFLKAPTILT